MVRFPLYWTCCAWNFGVPIWKAHSLCWTCSWHNFRTPRLPVLHSRLPSLCSWLSRPRMKLRAEPASDRIFVLQIVRFVVLTELCRGWKSLRAMFELIGQSPVCDTLLYFLFCSIRLLWKSRATNWNLRNHALAVAFVTGKFSTTQTTQDNVTSKSLSPSQVHSKSQHQVNCRSLLAHTHTPKCTWRVIVRLSWFEFLEPNHQAKSFKLVVWNSQTFKFTSD